MEVFIEFITILLLYYALAFFGHEAYGILVPQPSLNPWTTNEALKNTSLLDSTSIHILPETVQNKLQIDRLDR